MINVGIIGATGYTGSELIRLLLRHGGVKLVAIGARSTTGPVSDLHKSVLELTDARFCDLALDNYKDCDVVFLALPHGTSSEYAKALVEMGVKVIDLGADFRLNDATVYEKWYGADHACPEWMAETVYGLPELHREAIRESRLSPTLAASQLLLSSVWRRFAKKIARSRFVSLTATRDSPALANR
mgnify:CR=1 FL=1